MFVIMREYRPEWADGPHLQWVSDSGLSPGLYTSDEPVMARLFDTHQAAVAYLAAREELLNGRPLTDAESPATFTVVALTDELRQLARADGDEDHLAFEARRSEIREINARYPALKEAEDRLDEEMSALAARKGQLHKDPELGPMWHARADEQGRWVQEHPRSASAAMVAWRAALDKATSSPSG